MKTPTGQKEFNIEVWAERSSHVFLSEVLKFGERCLFLLVIYSDTTFWVERYKMGRILFDIVQNNLLSVVCFFLNFRSENNPSTLDPPPPYADISVLKY